MHISPHTDFSFKLEEHMFLQYDTETDNSIGYGLYFFFLLNTLSHCCGRFFFISKVPKVKLKERMYACSMGSLLGKQYPYNLASTLFHNFEERTINILTYLSFCLIMRYTCYKMHVINQVGLTWNMCYFGYEFHFIMDKTKYLKRWF